MPTNRKDRIVPSGITVLSIGVALLIFTFITAYEFLTQSSGTVASASLMQTFGDVLAPLIAPGIRLMYLGVMTWVASLMTVRGVAIIIHTPQLPPSVLQRQPSVEQNLPQTEPEKWKSERNIEDQKRLEESHEPEVAVIPSEAIPPDQLSNA